MKKIPKPGYLEHAVYYGQFIALVNTNASVLLQLKNNAKALEVLLKSLLNEQLERPYQSGKWTIKEILQHLMDVERVLMYRALRFSRNDPSAQPFFDENQYIENSIANELPIKKLLKEYKLQRQNTIVFFENQTAATLKRTGIASNTNMSVRACAWIICGHEFHHLNIIKERYLQSTDT
jgi:uncharacterized damage-inducible protein DinB